MNASCIPSKSVKPFLFAETHLSKSFSLLPASRKHATKRGSAIRAERTTRTIFGTQKPHQVSLNELIGSDGGEPRFMTPYFPFMNENYDPESLPLMFYVPGIDGTGLGAYRQLENIAKGFQLESFFIPIADKQDFRSLLKIFTSYVRNRVQSCDSQRVVYLMGESFGALLALAGAFECKDIVDRLILINPATGYSSSIWSNLEPLVTAIPQQLYSLLSGIAAPLVINPFGILSRNLDMTRPFFTQSEQIIENGLGMLETLNFINENVRADTVKRKLEIVNEGIKYINPFLHKIPQRTLVIAAENDLLLPSTEEAERLEKLLLRGFTKILPGMSHAFMEESGIDLLEILKEEEFYTKERKMSSPLNGKSTPLNRFGYPDPIEIPLKREVATRQKSISNTLELSSPVIFTTLSDGRIVEGFEGFPDSRPLVIVGNHTTMALDMNYLVSKLLSEKDILVRGLAHPSVMNEAINFVEMPEDATPFERGLLSLLNLRDTYKLYTTFGAVGVSAKNMYRLLSLGECILLYPGGVYEALKERDMKYQVVWPSRSEFVRMAAKFNATVVTVASVGTEDGIYQLVDSSEMIRNPLTGPSLQDMGSKMVKARSAALEDVNIKEPILIPPVFVPLKPQRQYYLFGKPMQLTPDLAENREKSDALYQHFKVELESGISYLIENRERDPYKEFEARLLYERLNQKKAPTFIPDPHPRSYR